MHTERVCVEASSCVEVTLHIASKPNQNFVIKLSLKFFEYFLRQITRALRWLLLPYMTIWGQHWLKFNRDASVCDLWIRFSILAQKKGKKNVIWRYFNCSTTYDKKVALSYHPALLKNNNDCSTEMVWFVHWSSIPWRQWCTAWDFVIAALKFKWSFKKRFKEFQGFYTRLIFYSSTFLSN